MDRGVALACAPYPGTCWRMATTSSVIGIDIGSTKSSVAVWKNDKVEILANAAQLPTTPSCVEFTDSKRRSGFVDSFGRADGPSLSARCAVSDTKRLIGKTFADLNLHEVQKRAHLPGCVVDCGPDGLPRICVPQGGENEEFRPEEIYAMIMQKMKNMRIKVMNN